MSGCALGAGPACPCRSKPRQLRQRLLAGLAAQVAQVVIAIFTAQVAGAGRVDIPFIDLARAQQPSAEAAGQDDGFVMKAARRDLLCRREIAGHVGGVQADFLASHGLARPHGSGHRADDGNGFRLGRMFGCGRVRGCGRGLQRRMQAQHHGGPGGHAQAARVLGEWLAGWYGSGSREDVAQQLGAFGRFLAGDGAVGVDIGQKLELVVVHQLLGQPFILEQL